MRHIRQKSHNSRTANQILVMLAFFSVSAGLWANFRQLWLQENSYSASDISTLTSIATFLSVGGVLLVGWKLRPSALKSFMTGILAFRLINSAVQLGLNGTGQVFVINLCTIIEIFTGYMIVASVYPLLTTLMKSNKIYSKRKLVEYLFRDVGVLIGGILIGQSMIGLNVDYNVCLAVSMVFLAMAMVTMFYIRVKPTASSSCGQKSAFRYILKSKIQTCYMLYAFLSSTSFATALGLKMLIMTNLLEFSASTATNYLLIGGLVGDVVGMVALKYFTPKNDYITMTLKFGIRLGAYIIAVLADNPFVFLLAFTWAMLSETAYEDVSDGHYINLVDNQHQLSYNTTKHVMNYLGEATGVLFCGWMYNYGLSAIFGLAATIMVFQMAIAYYLIHLRHRRCHTRHTASRLRYDERLLEE